jgi:hypothetical protein
MVGKGNGRVLIGSGILSGCHGLDWTLNGMVG